MILNTCPEFESHPWLEKFNQESVYKLFPNFYENKQQNKQL